MRFSNDKIELVGKEISLLGADVRQPIGRQDFGALYVATCARYKKEIESEWHCIDSFVGAGTPLEEVIIDEAINSFDSWTLLKMAVFLERIMDKR